MMSSSKRILGQVGIRVLLTVSSTIALTLIGWRAWDSPFTILAFDSLLAFLAITSAAYVYGTYRRDPSTQHMVFLAALVTQGIIYIGSSVDLILGLTSPTGKTAERLTSDIIEIALLAVTVFVAILLRNKTFSSKLNGVLFFGIIFGTLSFYGLLFVLVLTTLPEGMLIILSFAATILTLIAFLLSGRAVLRAPTDLPKYDIILILLSFTVFGIASIPLLLNLIIPSYLWTLSLTLQAGGFFSFTMAVAVPWQIDMGISRWRADAVIATLCSLALTPFIVFILVESWAPGIYIFLGAYYLSHVEAAALSGLIAFLVYLYSRKNPSSEYLPLILLFVTWAYMELHLVLFSSTERLLAGREPYIAYIIGSFYSIILLFWATHNVKHTKEQSMKDAAHKIISWICLVIATAWAGEYISGWVLSEFAEINLTPLAASIILVSNLLAMFAFIYLEYLLTTKGQGWESAGVVTAGFLALWIIRNILKAVFEVWRAGWWAAELLLLSGLVLGPVILGMLYLGSMFEAEASQRKATLYADLLGHDITNYLQAIQVALEIMHLENASSEVRIKALNDAKLSLTRADHLIRNVRHLGQPAHIHSENIERIDLVDCIFRALNQVKQISTPEEIEFKINKARGDCYVLANDLLTDVFMNLFRNAIKYSNHNKIIDVKIKNITLENQDWWQVDVIDFGRGIEPTRKESLFNRFMEDADGTGLGLWVVKALTESFCGTVDVMDRIKDDYTQGTVFRVTLLADTSENHTLH